MVLDCGDQQESSHVLLQTCVALGCRVTASWVLAPGPPPQPCAYQPHFQEQQASVFPAKCAAGLQFIVGGGWEGQRHVIHVKLELQEIDRQPPYVGAVTRTWVFFKSSKCS